MAIRVVFQNWSQARKNAMLWHIYRVQDYDSVYPATMLLVQLYARVAIWLACVTHFEDRTISLRGFVLIHEIVKHFFICLNAYWRQENERSWWGKSMFTSFLIVCYFGFSFYHLLFLDSHFLLLPFRYSLKPGIHDTSFASKSPFNKTWIKKTWIQVCVFTMQEILMNTHKFWREIQQTKWHFWEERRVLPFVLHYYVQLYCEGN